MKPVAKENKISSRRFLYLIGLAAEFFFGILYFTRRYEVLLDEWICFLTLQFIFLFIVILTLYQHRRQGLLPEGQSADYRRIFLLFLCCWGMEIAFTFCPEYHIPIMLVPMLLSFCMNTALALSFGIYFALILCMFQGMSTYVLYCYLLLEISGVMLLPSLKEKQRQKSLDLYVIYFLLNTVIPLLFFYLTYFHIEAKDIYPALINSLVVTAAIAAGYAPLAKSREAPKRDYAFFLEDTYPLVSDIKAYSMAEYHHARKVSRLAAVCAREIGANEMCCACAGFYYRLGKMEGEPEIDNALRLANDHCFPMDVMLIMEEYGGIIRLPQTPESAIVHMVDMLVTKIELLDQDTMSSTWNQDMVIYQSLNELSQEGFYDASGLSMNQFLHIREKLVSEELLL